MEVALLSAVIVSLKIAFKGEVPCLGHRFTHPKVTNTSSKIPLAVKRQEWVEEEWSESTGEGEKK